MSERFFVMRSVSIASLGVVLLAGTICPANEIGFLESFALAQNREEALKQLIAALEALSRMWTPAIRTRRGFAAAPNDCPTQLYVPSLERNFVIQRNGW